MPQLPKGYSYTSDSEINGWKKGDRNITATGAIIDIEYPREFRNDQNELHCVLRCLLSNMQGHKIKLCIWGDQINKYATTLYGQHVMITGANIYTGRSDSFGCHDLSTKITLNVNDKGNIEILGPVAEHIDFSDAASSAYDKKLVCIKGYVCSEFIYDNSTWFNSTIGDLKNKLCIRVKKGNLERPPISIGQQIKVTGTLAKRHGEKVFLFVPIFEAVEIIKGQRISVDEAMKTYPSLVMPNTTSRIAHNDKTLITLTNSQRDDKRRRSPCHNSEVESARKYRRINDAIVQIRKDIVAFNKAVTEFNKVVAKFGENKD